ncbi:uncharacterized protein STEHIDRAFT_122195, partial [Stereum hirsutum FP-91666 SS1]|uniref:uncharacterized protein n=1 Tax=Stereum hirsutum (strain FP-91666) TaxID=721885 RepID=UPI000444A8D7
MEDDTDNSDSDVPFPSDSEPPSVIRTPSLRSNASRNASAGPSLEVGVEPGPGEAEEEEEEAEPISPAYLAALQAHISATRARYTPSSKGKEKAEENEVYEYDESMGVQGIQTRWTEDEKDVFFCSLARHSRLRPDLIALDMQAAFPLSPSHSHNPFYTPKPKSLPEI